MPSKSPKMELKARGITGLDEAADSKTNLSPWSSRDTMRAGLTLPRFRSDGSAVPDVAHLLMLAEGSATHS